MTGQTLPAGRSDRGEIFTEKSWLYVHQAKASRFAAGAEYHRFLSGDMLFLWAVSKL